MSSFEERVLIRAKALRLVTNDLKRRVDTHRMSRKSYIESVLQAERRFMEAVAALRQKEGVDGHEQS